MTLELDAIIRCNGKPKMIVSEHEAELTSHDMLRWTQDASVIALHRARSIKNAFVGSFNGCLRDECLNETLFSSLVEVLT